MPKTPADLVRDHRDNYLRRKLVRSPLLNFMPGAFRVDVCSLFEGVRPNLPSAQSVGLSRSEIGVSEPSAFVSALIGARGQAIINNVKTSLTQKLLKIKRTADEVRHSTGQHALYFGYPCFILPGEAGKTKFAPVFLFSIDIQADPHRVTITRRGGDRTSTDKDAPDDALFNRLLAAFVHHEYGMMLGGGDESRLQIDPETIEQSVRKIFATWKKVAIDWEFPSATPALSGDTLKAMQRERDDPKLVDHAIIGLADFSGQSLLDDLDRIEQALRNGEACSGPLKNLLEPRPPSNHAPANPPAADDDKWLVEKSDPSQEAVIWEQRTSPLIVLQGPPGTGKSQTIVNTIADTVATKQNVLVVCQKRAATEVVKKRLEAVGLGDLVALVDDIDKDRAPIIKRIKDIDDEFPTTVWDAAKRQQLSIDIKTVETQIDAGAAALADDGDGSRLRFANIQALLTKLGLLDRNPRWSSTLRRIVEQRVKSGLSNLQLQAHVDHHQKIDASAKAYRYPENHWSAINPILANDPVSHDEIGQRLRLALSVGAQFEAGNLRLQHDDHTHWVAEHPWFSNTAAIDQGLPYAVASEQAQLDIRAFNDWLSALRYLNGWNDSIDPNADCRAVRASNYNVNPLKTFASDSTVLAEIAGLRAQIDGDDLLREADKSLRAHVKAWAPQLEAAVLHEWKHVLLQARSSDFKHSRNIETLCEKLSRDLIAKRRADTIDILSQHGGRVDARDTLANADMLRLRKSGPTPKTSLRRLHHSGSKAIKRIQPILLTSPENASNMLPLIGGHYDLVVIDEASQMFVAEAIPMLYRAKRALIAGDQQQMPPSNTFAFGSDDDDESVDSEEVDELAPSPVVAAAEHEYRLLDAADRAVGANSPSRRTLEIHYRSARKELIDFSNHAFYEGKLVIPSGNAALPEFISAAIEFEQIVGVFNRGINELEANRIVDRIVQVFELPENNRPTLGVIVNNIKQKARVEELLAERTARSTSLAAIYAAERDRVIDGEDVSFFVRSVENVQGDERDVVIFGATYSGDKRNFGPLTATGDGRKRLNVAVTRSRRGMIVLCSLTHQSVI